MAPTPILHRLRLRKEPHELERLREACRISSEAHELARSITRPGMNEAEVQAAMEAHFRSNGPAVLPTDPSSLAVITPACSTTQPTRPRFRTVTCC